jgi:hypothetical protein
VRALVIDSDAKAAVAKIVNYAEKPEHWYLVGPGGRVAPGSVPGDHPEHCLDWSGFTCVFSITKTVQASIATCR